LQYLITVIPVQPVLDLPEADQSVLEFQADSNNNDSGAHSAGLVQAQSGKLKHQDWNG
jgi:hypothetical protein